MAGAQSSVGKAVPKVAAAVEKERQVLQLRAGGATFDAIATRLGYANPGSAYKAMQRGLRRAVQEPADELRAIESDRLDRLQLAIWPAAVGGNLEAIDRVLGIMGRRARLFGLDAPTRLAGADGGALQVEVVDAREQLLQEVQQRRARITMLPPPAAASEQEQSA